MMKCYLCDKKLVDCSCERETLRLALKDRTKTEIECHGLTGTIDSAYKQHLRPIIHPKKDKRIKKAMYKARGAYHKADIAETKAYQKKHPREIPFNTTGVMK